MGNHIFPVVVKSVTKGFSVFGLREHIQTS